MRIFPDLPRLQEFIADTTQDMDQREWIWQHYGTFAQWAAVDFPSQNATWKPRVLVLTAV